MRRGPRGPRTLSPIPYFPSGSDPLGRQGFVRVVNHENQSGTVDIVAIDDAGNRSQPLTLAIDANQTRHFNSDDLAHGNSGKGLTGSAGFGSGDWRLELTSELDIEPLSYIRTRDGFLTAMHDVVPAWDGGYQVVFFNPGSNRSQVSLLRLVNPGTVATVVEIVGTDDMGARGGPVSVEVPPGLSLTFTAAELESGNAPGLTGALGDGAGKWRLTVTSGEPLAVMSLLSSPTGHLTNLSTIPADGEDGRHAVPLFPSASDMHGRQGFVRVVNHSPAAGTVSIRAFDDEGQGYPEVRLSIGPSETKHFNSSDLEDGNSGKGLSGRTGGGRGDWRLELTSELDLDVLSYIRTSDGFVTAMHDVAPTRSAGYWVPVFNPGSNTSQRSVLRLVSRSAASANVTITGTDDVGRVPGSEVRLTVPAGGSRMLDAQELEWGGGTFAGRAWGRQRQVVARRTGRPTGRGSEPVVESNRPPDEPVHRTGGGCRKRLPDADIAHRAGQVREPAMWRAARRAARGSCSRGTRSLATRPRTCGPSRTSWPRYATAPMWCCARSATRITREAFRWRRARTSTRRWSGS